MAAPEQELLPVGCVHLVFTMPEPLARLALVNKRVMYDLLFQAAAAILRQVARNPKRLGGNIGALMVQARVLTASCRSFADWRSGANHDVL